MIRKIDHIAIASKDIDDVQGFFNRLLGIEIGERETVDDQKLGSVDNFKKLMEPITEKKPDYVQLFVKRGNRTLFVFVKTLHQNDGSSEG